MRKIMVGILLVVFVCVPLAEAAKDPSRVTLWNRVTDFFATLGKSAEEKEAIIKDRKVNRREERMFESEQAEKKAVQEKMREQNEAIMEKINTKKVPHGRGGIDAP